MILEVNNLSSSYGEKKLLNNVSFSIEDNKKIGLIGVNGCGKSTLLKLISFEKEVEHGSINIIGKKKISSMMQEINLDKFNDLTIRQYIENDENLKQEISKNEMAFHNVLAIMTQLEILDFDKHIKELSGGTKRKLALGLALSKNCDLLILDEPTNHLDSDIIEWLEKFLIKSSKAIFLVTHDRYFLERVCNQIFELDNGSIYTYDSNYSLYLKLKSERLEQLKSQERKINAFLRKEYDWISRGAMARTTKDKRRIENYEALVSREKVQTKELIMDSNITRLGNKTIEFDDVSFGYNELLFKNLSFNLSKDERIGIIGKNGCGKSTLLDLISQKINPTSGKIEIGLTVKIGYFNQNNIELDYNTRCIEYITNIASYVKTKKGYISASQMLENFLFDDPYIYIGKLSGGEKRRLYLLGVLMSEPNVLLLDEPTNDLDIITLQILEDYLDDFKGIVLTVSHDRYFIDRVCNKIWAFNNKSIDVFNGNYKEYKEIIANNKNDKTSVNNLDKSKVTNKTINKQVKLTYKENLEFETILELIDDIEKRINECVTFINNNINNYELCKEYIKKKEELETLYEEKLKRWEYLSNIHDNNQ